MCIRTTKHTWISRLSSQPTGRLSLSRSLSLSLALSLSLSLQILPFLFDLHQISVQTVFLLGDTDASQRTGSAADTQNGFSEVKLTRDQEYCEERAFDVWVISHGSTFYVWL